jgi:hypothetical protein
MRCATLAGLTMFVLLFCIVFVGSMLLDANMPDYAIGGAEAEAKPAPNITEPGNPLFEGVTMAIALIGGGFIFWRMIGGSFTPLEDEVRRHG